MFWIVKIFKKFIKNTCKKIINILLWCQSGEKWYKVVEQEMRWIQLLIGEYEHSLDVKGRLIMPSKLSFNSNFLLFFICNVLLWQWETWIPPSIIYFNSCPTPVYTQSGLRIINSNACKKQICQLQCLYSVPLYLT